MDLKSIFTYHPPTGNQNDRYVAIRTAALAFAELAVAHSPASSEQTLAIRDLQRSVQMFNAAIAINE